MWTTIIIFLFYLIKYLNRDKEFDYYIIYQLPYEHKKKKKNPNEFFKLELIFQIHNTWNPKLKLNQKVQFSTNFMLNNEIKKINLKKK
jgi:hypothetical protein